MKMTFQPKKRSRAKVHGFRARMSTPGGRKVLAARRAKGRKQLSVRENGMDKNRLGISVSKKVGNSVVRHHLTRLIRESYRLQEEHFQCGFDLVVIARAGAKEKSYHDIESALIHLGKLHNIYA